jgi:hypothetical protein
MTRSSREITLGENDIHCNHTLGKLEFARVDFRRSQQMSTIRHVALVSESNRAKMNDLLRVSAALQKQASRDLAPIWDVSSTVDAFAKLEDVPDGYWPMIIKDDIGINAAGVHKDKDGQPFALISAADSVDTWSLTSSHELCEMLVDPSGDKQMSGDSPMPGQERVSFLVEVCDPSEASDFAYTVNGVLVSDFYTPHYFDPMKASGVRYSFTGALTEPRQVLRGGYLSWKDSVSGDWFQEIWLDGNAPSFRNIGAADGRLGSIRAFIDRKTGELTAKAIGRGRASSHCAGMTVSQAQRGLQATAAMWRKQIADISGQPSAPRSKAKRSYAKKKSKK